MQIPVRPKNYRSIALAALARSDDPIVLVDGRRVTDYSTNGPITQTPDEMWIAITFRELAEHCAREGWLKIQGAAS